MYQLHQHRPKKRVLFIITHGHLGGAQTHVLHLSRKLSESLDIHVAMGVQGVLWEQLRKAGIPVHHLPSLVRNVSPFLDLKGLLEIIRLLKDLSPDLVTVHSSKAGILGRIAAKICNIPAIYTAHGWSFMSDPSKIMGKAFLIAERMVSLWSKKIICVSEHDAHWAINSKIGYPHQLIAIHNGLPSSSEDCLAQPGNQKNPIKIIMVARFSEPKDHPLLIKAVSEINKDYRFQVFLVGDGPLLSHCVKLSYQLKTSDRIHFLGSRCDVPNLLAQSQIFVLASKGEGFPLCILEAMRAGLPVIASDVGGVGESVSEGETGFLIPKGNVYALKEKLSTLMSDFQLRQQMGIKGREKFLQRFTVDQMSRKTLAVYHDTMVNQNG